MLSLGLALALNTTVFALSDAVLHPPVPYPQPDRVVIAGFLGGDRRQKLLYDEAFRAVRDGLTTYDAIASYRVRSATVQTATTAEDYRVYAVSPGFFDLLRVRPVLGRAFVSGDGAVSAQEAVISYRLWARLFYQRPLWPSLTLDIGGRSYTVIGVMPRGVHFPVDADLWVPDEAAGDSSLHMSGAPTPVLRLKPDATTGAVRSQLELIARRLTAELSPQRPLAPKLMTPSQWLAGYRATLPFSSLISVAVAMVLVIACANLGTMMLARGMARRRETAIRIALGASRRVVIAHVLLESGVVTACGAVLGLLLTWWSLHLIPHFASPYVPVLGDLQPVPSWRVFLFVFVATVLMLLAAGITPALRASAVDPAEPMKEGSGTTTPRMRDRYNPLIISEVALSTALLMSAALFTLYVFRIATIEFHFPVKRLVVAYVQPGATRLPRGGGVDRFYDDVLARARQLPHARYAATSYGDSPDGPMVYAEEGRSGERWINLRYYAVVSPDYFRTFGIPVMQGRDFEAGDASAGDGAVIVDEDAAKRLWPDVPSPVSHMIKLGDARSARPWLRVIGVVPSVDLMPAFDAASAAPRDPGIYMVDPHDRSRKARELVIQGDGIDGVHGREALALALRRMIELYAPSLGMPAARPWLEPYESVRDASAFLAWLLGTFGIFGLALCAVGLYGVLAYAVSRRVREFAIRIALGAPRREIARLVLYDVAVTALAGIGIGAFVALWVTHEMNGSLAGMRWAPAVALIMAECVLLAVAFAACLAPVRRAISADPVEALRAN